MEPVDFFILLIAFIILFLWCIFHNPLGTGLAIIIFWGIYKLSNKYKNGPKSRK